MRIAVIVINYGMADLSIAAVESVLATCGDDPECSLYLVDNDSPGDDAARLKAAAATWGDKVSFRAEATNHGFARGNNLVLRDIAALPEETRPDYVFLLNPDAVVLEDAIHQLARVLEDTPELAAVGAAIVDTDRVPAVSAFRFPTWISELVRVIDFGPLKRLTAGYRVSLPASLPRQDVDWVSGAAVMFRLEALLDVDFFDPEFFLYYEEVDLMWRLTEAGWRIRHVPEAVVLHHAGMSTGLKSDGARRRNPGYVYESWAHYFAQRFGRLRALGLAILLLPAGILNVLLFALRGRPPSLPKRFFRDHARHAIWSLARGGA